MGTIRGTNINPSVLESPLDQFKILKKGKRSERKVLKEQLDRWNAFKKTPSGRACAILADPMISRCNHILDLSPIETGHPVEVLNEYKAEIRGQRRVWMMIKNEPNRLEQYMEELGEVEEDEETQAGWAESKKS